MEQAEICSEHEAWQRTVSLTEVSRVAVCCGQELRFWCWQQSQGLWPRPFCLWLHGPMGAGKTTFTRFLLHALGSPTSLAVTSPTFVLATVYPSAVGDIAHLDLSRLHGTPPESVQQLGVEPDRVSGLVVEWPLRGLNSLCPSHHLVIAADDDDEDDEEDRVRHYTFYHPPTYRQDGRAATAELSVDI